jgi:hypothetical protein
MADSEFENTATDDGAAFDFMAELVKDIKAILKKETE